nr:NAD-dependent epimerase/dehydratase family protein [Acidocella sp. KAb 2-4]
MVFGSTGYVGRHVTARLAEDGHAVTSYIRHASAVPGLEKIGARTVFGDLEDLSALPDIIAAQDAVIWMAQLMHEGERRVVSALLETLRGTGKTFIFTGGTSLLSIRTDGDWDERSFAEDDVFTPRRQVAPRLEVERMVRQSTADGVRGICIRPPLIWGNGGARYIADMYHSAQATGAVCYVGRGLNLYSNVHVEDLADVYSRAIERGVGGALYHAVSGELNNRMMAEGIARHLGIGTRSVTVEESIQIWDKFTGPIVFSACSRTRCPRTRAELGWGPNPNRLDILEDCTNPVYASQATAGRTNPAWVKTSAA